MELIDVSVPIRPGMPVYEGNPEVRFERAQAIADGAAANVSRLDFGVHTGTHVDAPVHFIEGGAGVDQVALDALIGPALVIDATAVDEVIDAVALERLDPPADAERLLFKTTNSELWGRDRFTPEFVRLGDDAARVLVERGVRLVGIDYLSVGKRGAHLALLGAGVVVLEGLDLRFVAPGSYGLICLPLRIVGSDGGPARALLTRE
jgi:arylformamidase